MAIANHDIGAIRKLVNAWCRLDQLIENKTLLTYAKEKEFHTCLDLLTKIKPTLDMAFAIMGHDAANGATLRYYIMQANNLELIKIVLNDKCNNLNELMWDDDGNELPVYFTMFSSSRLSDEVILRLTPKWKEAPYSGDLSSLRYRGLSFLWFAIQNNVNFNLLKILLSSDYCQNELLSNRNKNNKTIRDWAIDEQNGELLAFIDGIIKDYVINNRTFRNSLIYNGYQINYILEELLQSNEKFTNESYSFQEYIDAVRIYTNQISQLHRYVDNNCSLDLLKQCLFVENSFDLPNNLILSREIGNYQTIIHKLVLQQNYPLLEYLFEHYSHIIGKFDMIRDHCNRTPYHYACGLLFNDIQKLLSQFGASDFVTDKDGKSPLDFEVRRTSPEVQQLLLSQLENSPEPNPWTDDVWYRLQTETRINNLRKLSYYSLCDWNQNHSELIGFKFMPACKWLTTTLRELSISSSHSDESECSICCSSSLSEIEYALIENEEDTDSDLNRQERRLKRKRSQWCSLS
ncbi:unnamed protein product [Didymodactylos carnosus]|uniref:Ankyrin repeat protein n=1 Tax=Didymodactylos carnosus TaxID=1234261 RepID=A0A8S2NF63_9BILA|nr:unnamed protein product [Didymodactylos carnosus]CAF3996043.1 unnamed protein product [Didymodactylos carnosus]